MIGDIWYMNNNNKETALSLIETKEFLTDAEKDIVLSYSPDLVWKFLNKIEDNRWLNINVYSERERDDEKYDIPFFIDI